MGVVGLNIGPQTVSPQFVGLSDSIRFLKTGKCELRLQIGLWDCRLRQ